MLAPVALLPSSLHLRQSHAALQYGRADLDEMLLVTPSWPGVIDQLMHCVAHLLIKFRRLPGGSHV
ncbi:hypothetical protein T4B_4091 [Trichinella pseudospiralis]|uniref:Uncharacterized protein n=1 Tax=Trichinella pseudospiralis TaxID=6337 RepID=A0A0V1H266_TRIPS|nr:hypothetical protein T4B_4091 [Trichinella pseudospiralis]KRZ04186.1 hypothetical protein T4C_10341 [Trichinella pseudospiralis]